MVNLNIEWLIFSLVTQKQSNDRYTCIFDAECIGIYGGGRRIITEMGANEMPYGLTLKDTSVYWTDWKK